MSNDVIAQKNKIIIKNIFNILSRTENAIFNIR